MVSYPNYTRMQMYKSCVWLVTKTIPMATTPLMGVDLPQVCPLKLKPIPTLTRTASSLAATRHRRKFSVDALGAITKPDVTSAAFPNNHRTRSHHLHHHWLNRGSLVGLNQQQQQQQQKHDDCDVVVSAAGHDPGSMKEPFVKNLFLGKFDKNILAYPDESVTEYEVINELFTPVEKSHSTGNFSSDGHKRLMASTVKHVLARTMHCTKPEADFDVIQDKLSKMAVSIYAMESVTHLTSAVKVTCDDPDVMTVESAIVQIFNTENDWYQVSECLQILGVCPGNMADDNSNRHPSKDDINFTHAFKERNDEMRSYVALQGLRHTHLAMDDILSKVCDPIRNPALAFKSPLRKCIGKIVSAQEPLELHNELHPQLQREAKVLENGILQLSSLVEHISTEYGKKVVQDQPMLKRLADIAIDIYVMTACIGRASKSLYGGSGHAHREVLMTKAFCYESEKRIKTNVEDLNLKTCSILPDETPDRHTKDIYHQIAKDVLTNGGFGDHHTG